MNKIFVYCLMPLFCLANVNYEFSLDGVDRNESVNIINSASYGEKVISERKLETSAKVDDDFPLRKELILNWHYFYTKQNPRANESVGKKTALVVAVANKDSNSSTESNISDNLIVVKGYCFINDDINVGKQASSLRVDCQSNVGNVVMFANLVNVNEQSSLVVDPKYIEKNGYRFEVKSAIVTNESKTSYNVATFVNDRKLAEVGLSTLSVSSDEFKTVSNEYLKALEDSKRKQEVQYLTTTDGAGNSYMMPSTVTNTEKPDPLDYLVKAGINVASSAVKTTADIFKKDLPYLYEIKANTKIWIDLKVNRKGDYVK